MTGTAERVLERLALDRFRPWLVVATLASGLLVLLFFYAWGYQLVKGIGVVGMNRPVTWGLYEATFVFWIGISHAGTLISAILRVTGAEWRRPVTRCAEAITVFALCVGGLFPILHLGRAWKVYWVMPLPNSRGLWPNYRSPLAWDSVAISAYLIGSILYLALPLLPDLAIVRDRAKGWRRRFWGLAALGWSGTPQQWRSLEAGIKVMAIVIIPLAVSVHTIVSWDFAMTLVPMWTSTIFGPYFVVGAIYSGIAALLVAMALLRWGLELGEWLSDTVFSKLALLFLVMTLAWGYFTFSEHLTAWYTNEVAEARVLWLRLTGAAAPPFWTMVVLNFVVPMLVLPFRRGRRPLPLLIVGLGVMAGMWLERILIVVPSLATPRLAYTVGSYFPSWVELSILAGSAGLFLFLYLVFMQAAPILSVWEIAEGERHAAPAGAATGQATPAHATPANAPAPAPAMRAAAASGAGTLLPPPAEELESSLATRRSRAHVWGIAGGIGGGLAGWLLALFTAKAWPIVTGHMPIVAAPTSGIVVYEGIALGAVLATTFCVLLEGGLLRRRSKSATASPGDGMIGSTGVDSKPSASMPA